MSQLHLGYTVNPDAIIHLSGKKNCHAVPPWRSGNAGRIVLRRPKQRLILPRWKHVYIKRHYLAIKDFSAAHEGSSDVPVFPASSMMLLQTGRPFQYPRYSCGHLPLSRLTRTMPTSGSAFCSACRGS